MQRTNSLGETLTLPQAVQREIDNLRWESIQQDNSVWNPRAVSLDTLIQCLKEDGHVITARLIAKRAGDTYELAGLDRVTYQDMIETWEVTIDGERVLIEVLHGWHGGQNSGGPYTDSRVVGGLTCAAQST